MMHKLRRIKHLTMLLPICVLTLAGCSGLGNLVNPQFGPATQAPDAPVSSDDQPAGGMPTSPLDPIPGEDKMARGEVTISESEVLLLESFPMQVVLSLKGTLSTPCHHLRAKVSPPDAQNRIQVEVYSLYDPDEICIQMLQAFDTKISLGSYPDGGYTVWLNGVQVGEFTQ
jgi:hypothetical protein